eukprot:m.258974 g.258974  ORF g.258974 m.258974 type:complete len:164 (+) comp40414_c0_seq89:997-1488(+)
MYNRLDDLPDGFSWSQVQGILASAKNAWGSVKKWSKRQLQKLSKIAVNFPVANILELNPDVVADVVENWNDLVGWSFSQKGAITDRLKSTWGAISQWSISNLKKIPKLIDGMSVDDLKQLNFESLVKLTVLQENLGLRPKQVVTVIQKKEIRAFDAWKQRFVP